MQLEGSTASAAPLKKILFFLCSKTISRIPSFAASFRACRNLTRRRLACQVFIAFTKNPLGHTKSKHKDFNPD
jgi:hypothetical protein